jgi:hypothetical protein
MIRWDYKEIPNCPRGTVEECVGLVRSCLWSCAGLALLLVQVHISDIMLHGLTATALFAGFMGLKTERAKRLRAQQAETQSVKKERWNIK